MMSSHFSLCFRTRLLVLRETPRMMCPKIIHFLVPLLLATTLDLASGLEFNLNSSFGNTQDMTCAFDGSTTQISGIIQINVIAISDNEEKRLATISGVTPTDAKIDNVNVMKAVGNVTKKEGFVTIRMKTPRDVQEFACRTLVLDKNQKAVTIEKVVPNNPSPLTMDSGEEAASGDMGHAFTELEHGHAGLQESLERRNEAIEELAEKIHEIEDSVSGVSGLAQDLQGGFMEDISETKELAEKNNKELENIKKKVDTVAEMMATMQSGFVFDLHKMSQNIDKTTNLSKVLAKRAEATSCDELKDHRSFTLPPRAIITTPEGRNLLCDTETHGGGWTVFQRRIDAEVDFYRGWDDYENGFGSFDSSFWLGLELIHNMTSEHIWQLRVDFEYDNRMYYAEYSMFKILDPDTNYKLVINGYSGNAGDSLKYHNDKPFSTFDKNDNSDSEGNCAEMKKGAWWYNNCQLVHMNGQWGSKEPEVGVNWRMTTGNNASATFTEMKMRMVPANVAKAAG